MGVGFGRENADPDLAAALQFADDDFPRSLYLPGCDPEAGSRPSAQIRQNFGAAEPCPASGRAFARHFTRFGINIVRPYNDQRAGTAHQRMLGTYRYSLTYTPSVVSVFSSTLQA
jgi:hypothetical protein